jgi:tRNA pseudouridine55 synthase
MEIASLAEEFTGGKVLLFNKPLYWTSFDLVRKVKNILQNRLKLKKLKVGHAGTLDPLATGVMIICTGKETRNIDQYQSLPKEYHAKIMLGSTTPSFDLETDIDASYPVRHISKKIIEEVLSGFTGIQQQKPPEYSALNVNGKRAYTMARKGVAVELLHREIDIHAIDLVHFDLPVIEIYVRCSKGTYIRALARDIGSRLGSGAHLTGLVRTAIGNFKINDALGIEEFERNFILL